MSLELISPHTLKEPPPPVDWLVKHVIARGAVTVLAGDGGLGKSGLALALCAAINSDQTFYAGLRTFPAPVAYVDSENPFDEIHRRANAFEVYEHIYQFTGDLSHTAEQIALAEAVARVPDGLLVLDSFRTLFPSQDENSTKDVAPIMNFLKVMARAHNVGILLLHHTSKASSGWAGSTAFSTVAEILCTLKRGKGFGERYLEWQKKRLGMEQERHYLRIEQQNGSMHWEQSSAPVPGIKIGP